MTRYHLLRLAPGIRDAMSRRAGPPVRVPPPPILATTGAPTLLRSGARDAMVPMANAADDLKAMPTARLVTLPGADHLPQEEATQASVAALQAFLRE
ncbi:MAG: alpha/beta hydrolase [Burkholderiaceae bacterium]|nr:alpha/beta hydrolase [Burkholderiaceae bacterium]